MSDIEEISNGFTDNKNSYEKNVASLDIYDCYKKSPYLSIKHSSYFQVYAELLEQYRNRPITFVEIGILNGGSLFMWREYFGEKARIIGIDLNPLAKRWEEAGFEIHIGSQSNELFWNELFKEIGDVDIVLDDGGHTYEQQIVTAHNCIPHIKDGGLLIVEDTHTSYFKKFGYPSKYTFIEWIKVLIDNINSRFPAVKVSDLPYKDSIYSITVYESIVSLRIKRDQCFESAATSNNGISMNAKDFRYNEIESGLGVIFNRFQGNKRIQKIKKSLTKRIVKLSLTKLKKYFRT